MHRVFPLIGMLATVSSLGLCLLIFSLYLCIARPAADDYGRATTSSLVDAASRSHGSYFNWCGRWASIGFQHTGWALVSSPSKRISVSYTIYLAGTLAVAFVVVTLAVSQLTNLSFVKTIGFTALLSLTYFSFFHEPGQSIFWIPGVSEGTLSASFLFLGFSLLISDPKSLSTLRAVGIGILITISAGCHELGGLVGSSFVAVYAAGYFWIFRGSTSVQYRSAIALAIVLAIAGTAISVFAPGNSVRSSQEFSDPPALFSIANSFSQVLLRTSRVLLSPIYLLGIVLGVTVFGIPKTLRSNTASSPQVHYLVLVAAGGSLIATCALYGFAAYNNPAGRTVNFFASASICLITPSLFVIFQKFSFILNTPENQPYRTTLLLLFSAAVITGPTIDKGFFSYKKDLLPWIRAQDSRHRTLTAASGKKQSEVILDPLPNPPPLLFNELEISSDPDYFGNYLREIYYGIDRIWVRSTDTE